MPCLCPACAGRGGGCEPADSTPLLPSEPSPPVLRGGVERRAAGSWKQGVRGSGWLDVGCSWVPCALGIMGTCRAPGAQVSRKCRYPKPRNGGLQSQESPAPPPTPAPAGIKVPYQSWDSRLSGSTWPAAPCHLHGKLSLTPRYPGKELVEHGPTPGGLTFGERQIARCGGKALGPGPLLSWNPPVLTTSHARCVNSKPLASSPSDLGVLGPDPLSLRPRSQNPQSPHSFRPLLADIPPPTLGFC